MKDWKVTKGNEFKVIPAYHIGCTNVYLGDFMGEIEFWHHHGNTSTKEEAIANAELTCDAFNTIQKCGLMPSELLEQRDELLECLSTLLKENRIKEASVISGPNSILNDNLTKANELINKITE